MTIPIFVISLTDSERRKKISQQFSEYGIPYTFFDAIDCRHGVPDIYAHMVDTNRAYKALRRPLLHTEIGCALSHRLLHQHIVKNHIQHAIVLEDDVILTDNFKVFYNNRVYKKLNADILFLYHMRACVYNNTSDVYYGIHYYKPKFTPYSTAGYYLNVHVAKAWLGATTPIIDVADSALELTAYFNVQTAYPRIVQHPPLSDTQSYLEKDRKLFYGQNVMPQKKYSLLHILWYSITLQSYTHTKHRYASFWAYITRKFIRGTALRISPNVTGDTIIPPRSVLQYMVDTIQRYMAYTKERDNG